MSHDTTRDTIESQIDLSGDTVTPGLAASEGAEHERPETIRPLFEAAVATLVLVLIVAIAVFGLWHTANENLAETYRRSLCRIASAAAGVLDGDLHSRINHPDMIDGALYEEAIAPLRAMYARTEGVKYMYTAVRDGETIRFVLDAAQPGDHDGDGVEDRAAVWEPYDEFEPFMLKAFGTAAEPGIAIATQHPYSDKWGTFMTGYAPLYNREGAQVGLVGVDMDASEFLYRLQRARLAALTGLAPGLAVSFIVGTLVYGIRRRAAASIQRLTESQAALAASGMKLAEVYEQELQTNLILASTLRELEQQQTCAQAASQAKSAFLANMSHEIRTPLTAILGYCDVLRDDEQLAACPERRRELLDTIDAAGRHLLTIINDILDLSKIEAGRMTIETIDMGLIALVDEVVSILTPAAIKKGLQLDIVLLSPVPDRVVGDPTRLRQIIMNLLGNALKFTSAGTVTLCLQTISDSATQRLQIRVIDTGVGMSAAQASLLFEAFSQADSSTTRRFGGTGLGLAISRRLAQLLGGSVSLVRTAEGEGSEFLLDLPLHVSEQSSWVKTLEPSKPAAVETNTAIQLEGRILLAEDGPDNQRLISLLLRKAGATVEIAGHGGIALDMLARAQQLGQPFDLLLTDMQMPEMDGYTLASMVRERGDALPVIALTAHAMAGDARRCLDAGCHDYATKPIEKAKLLRVVQRWLQTGKAWRAGNGSGSITTSLGQTAAV
jgi:signal transduction histidine kinase/FixJ family two-component response regulator